MAKRKSKADAIPLPPGFRQASRGNFPASWDYRRNRTLQGIVREIRDVPKGKNVDKDTQVMSVVQPETGEILAVWKSAALAGLFDEVKKGDSVFIRYDGEVKVKGRRQPMHGFTAGVAESGKQAKARK